MDLGGPRPGTGPCLDALFVNLTGGLTVQGARVYPQVNSAERLGLGKARLAESPKLLIVSLSGLQSLMGRPSLFAFQGFVEMEDGQPPSSQCLSATVAASTIARRIESIRAGDSSGRYVRVSVTGPGRLDEGFS
eukprot:s149_g22.t1